LVQTVDRINFIARQRDPKTRRATLAGLSVFEIAQNRAPASSGEEQRMTEFDEREEAFERRFAHDQTIEFKALARRNKLLGLWVADLIGKRDEAADAYAAQLVAAQAGGASDDDLFDAIRADIALSGAHKSDHRIRRTMDELLVRARAEIIAGI